MVLFGLLFCKSSAELEQLILTKVKKLHVLLDIIHCGMAQPGGMFSHETFLDHSSIFAKKPSRSSWSFG
jgi:hypothetical protein